MNVTVIEISGLIVFIQTWQCFGKFIYTWDFLQLSNFQKIYYSMCFFPFSVLVLKTRNRREGLRLSLILAVRWIRLRWNANDYFVNSKILLLEYVSSSLKCLNSIFALFYVVFGTLFIVGFGSLPDVANLVQLGISVCCQVSVRF